MPSLFTNIRRLSFSFALFSGVLTGALLLSSHTLLPRLTQVEVEGKIEDLRALRAYAVQLEAEVMQKEQERQKHILPVQDSLYRELMQHKHASPDTAEIFTLFQDIAGEFVAKDNSPAVLLQHMNFYLNENAVDLKGIVRGVGPRSMTVLAQFAEALKEVDVVQSLHPLQFSREDDADLGTYSPLNIRLTLRP